jgi:hypothetical protein
MVVPTVSAAVAGPSASNGCQDSFRFLAGKLNEKKVIAS